MHRHAPTLIIDEAEKLAPYRKSSPVVELRRVCGFQFHESDSLVHVCDLSRSLITGQHEPARTHCCAVHEEMKNKTT